MRLGEGDNRLCCTGSASCFFIVIIVLGGHLPVLLRIPARTRNRRKTNVGWSWYIGNENRTIWWCTCCPSNWTCWQVLSMNRVHFDFVLQGEISKPYPWRHMLHENYFTKLLVPRLRETEGSRVNCGYACVGMCVICMCARVYVCVRACLAVRACVM